MDPLAASISAILRAHDPLDPWLTESSWDENYWNDESEEIARRVSPGMKASNVREVIVDVLGDLLGSSADGNAGLRVQRRMLDRSAAEIAQVLKGQTP